MDESTLNTTGSDSFISNHNNQNIEPLTDNIKINTSPSQKAKYKEKTSYSDIIKSISSLLVEIINDNISCKNTEFVKKDSFYSNKITNITLEEYIQRIVKYTKVEQPTLICAIIYIDKICEEHNYVLCFNNIHRILMTAIILSIKFYEDKIYSQTYYAKVGGFTPKELNNYENLMFNYLNYNLFISSRYYEKYEKYLKNKKLDI